MSSLNELITQSNSLMLAISEAGGELTPEIETALANVDLAVAAKVDGYKFVMDQMEAQAAFFKARADEFTKASRSLVKAQDRLEQHVIFAMQALGKTEVQGEAVKFKLSPTKGRLVITDDASIPAEYKVQVISMEIDKEKVKSALSIGSEVPGAKLEGGVSLRALIAKGKG